MRVEFTGLARRDLRKIAFFIADDNTDRVLSFVIELEDACLGLAGNPKRFPLIPRYEQSGIRRRVHGNYLIFYQVAETVRIPRELNSAMDYEPLLFPGN